MANIAPTLASQHIPSRNRNDKYSVAWFAILCCLPLVLGWHLTHALLTLVLMDDTFSHVPLIPVVSLFLIYMERSSIFSESSHNWWLGSIVLAPGVLIFLLARVNLWSLSAANQISLLMLGIVTIWIGAFILFFGTRAFKIASFPLFFLIFAIPIPEPVLSRTVSFLQHASADATSAIFGAFGVPVLRQDLIFVLPGVSIRVAEECSGIRSTLALLITTALAGHMFLRSKVRTLLLCALVIPVAILKNGMRIAVLSCLAVYVDPGFLHGRLHRYGGIPFFVVGLLMLGTALAVLRRGQRAGVYEQRGNSVIATG
jgi:exosortase